MIILIIFTYLWLLYHFLFTDFILLQLVLIMLKVFPFKWTESTKTKASVNYNAIINDLENYDDKDILLMLV